MNRGSQRPQDHPLRQCATRLKAKAERLLKHITDYKERADPVIPGEVPVRGITPRLNGVTLNGTSRHHSTFRSPSPTKPTVVLPGQSKKIQRDSTFAESTALLRSQAGMTAFLELERDVDDYLTREDSLDPSDPAVRQLKERLLRYASADEDGESPLSGEGSMSTIDGNIGAKRKLSVSMPLCLFILLTSI